ncbi:D-isomer specific 2-hydroxyacid dehydrogenase NAD-binding [Candidatus Vecturithrix granuli]|uniref:D-isomer specific 2-hydroxyacid dehydrogenase NAD-binding n=1 Tax=Vecturithrix granuli TaxID=1499967 RepID=A0A081C906_VECG1|nr:D-isomer specific 2-hydroxyacid dehydrogenase NAD-binding [Candidatus Vecturithrix granuli]
MGWKVLVTSLPMLATIEYCQKHFEAKNFEVVVPEIRGQQLSEAALCEIIAEFDGVLAGDDPFTANVLETGRKGRLRALVRWGIGIDAVDVKAAQRLGIRFSNTPGVFNDEVADIAIGYLLLLARGLHKVDAAARNGQWLKYKGRSLRGKVAGVVGVGNIGKEIVRRVRSFGMETIGYQRHALDPDFLAETGMRQVEGEELFRSADCIFLACSLNPENYHLLNARAFAMMKAGVWIINVARGALIDEHALLDALECGKVGAAGLDVFENEPLPAHHPLRRFEQVVLGAHNGSNTHEAVLRASKVAIDLLARFLRETH